ncbi:MAG: hypothetical protein N3D10_01870, partial [Candidatus Micrarchaeota archaeon]|nr:hypothetical protein [Candidatus Micrarchaeota archaeon]
KRQTYYGMVHRQPRGLVFHNVSGNAFIVIPVSIAMGLISKNVNLVKVIELNGSASCNPLNLSLPWGNSFKKVAKFNFSSVNLSNQQQAALVAQAIGNLIQVQIARPFSFESSRIYVNSSALSSLNTSATVILYDLPFSTTPSVTYDEGPFDGSISWSQGPFNEQFGFFTGNLTLSLNKFSGYNISDKSNPTITISSPLSNQFYNNNKLINITANGTGTAISNLTITIRNSSGQVVNTFNYIFNGTNSANCTNKSAGYDQINCILYNVNLDPGIYNLTVVAYDFGSGNGNSANSSRLFQTNNFAPVINSVSITPTEAYKFNNLTCTVSPQNPDLEEIGDTLTINYKWYVNNNLVFSQSSTNLSSTLTNENYTDFDNVTCLVTVTDSYDQSAIQNTSKTILFSSHNILNLSSENKTTSSINISYSNTQTNGKGYLTIPSNTTLSNISQAYPKGLVFISEVVNLSSGDLAFNNSRASKFSNLTIKLGPAGLKFSPNITFSFNYSSLSSEIIQSINDLLQAGDLVVKKCQDNGSNCISVPIVSYNTTTKIITVSIDSFSSLGLYDNSAEQEPQTPSTSSSSNSGGGAILRSSPPTQTSSSEETKPPSPTSNEFKEEQPLPPKPPSKPIEQPSLPSEPQETQNKIETFQQQIPAEPATTVAETKEQAAASSSDNSLILGVVGLTLVILIGGGTLIWWLKARKSKGLI